MSARGLATGALAAGAVLPPLYRAAVRGMLRRNAAALAQGDPRGLFAGYHDDVRFRFPGTSSWAGEFRGRAAVEAWVRRFVAAGLVLTPQEIVVDGPPWDTRICVRYTDRCVAGGQEVYENRGTIFGRIAWGRLREYEVHEDTHKVEAFDGWLAEHGAPAAAPVTGR